MAKSLCSRTPVLRLDQMMMTCTVSTTQVQTRMRTIMEGILTIIGTATGAASDRLACLR